MKRHLGKLMLVAMLVGLFSQTGFTEEWNLEQVINWGLQHHVSLNPYEEKVRALEQTVESYKVNLIWQLDLSGNLGYEKNTFTLNPLNQQQLTVGLAAQRTYPWGLSLSPVLVYQESFSPGGAGVENNLNWKVELMQRLYPRTISAAEQEYLPCVKLLEQARVELIFQQGVLRVEWIKEYLQMLRQAARVRILQESYQYAENLLNRTLKQQEIGEAGEIQVLSARIAYKEAELALDGGRNELEQRLKLWHYLFQLPEGVEVIVALDNEYLQNQRGRVDRDFGTREQILQNHPTAKGALAQVELTRNRRDWNQKHNAEAGVYLNYNQQLGSWGVNLGVNLDYQLLDGGEKKLRAKGYEAQLAQAESSYQSSLQMLDLELTGLENAVQLAQKNLTTKELVVQKVQLEEKYAKERLIAGLITESEYQKKQTELKLAEVMLEEAKDEVFAAKLRVAQFCGGE